MQRCIESVLPLHFVREACPKTLDEAEVGTTSTKGQASCHEDRVPMVLFVCFVSFLEAGCSENIRRKRFICISKCVCYFYPGSLGCLSTHTAQYPQTAKVHFPLLISVCLAGTQAGVLNSIIYLSWSLSQSSEQSLANTKRQANHPKYFNALDHMVSFEIIQFCC